MTTLHWGIIGCGNVTESKSGPAFNLAPGSSLDAVMRRNAHKAADYAARHGVPRWYDKADELLADPAINAIYIATPPDSHADYALRSLEAGKFVYLEKPMARNAKEATRIVEAAARHDDRLCIAHYRRAQPMFLKIKELLDRQAIGEVRFVSMKMLQPAESDIIAASEENWRIDPVISGGGLFHDLAPHQLDLMYYFFGEIDRAHGFAVNQAGYYPTDDLVTGEILFKQGIVFQGTWCFSVSPEEKTDICEITGAAGKITFPVFGNEVTVSRPHSNQTLVFPVLAHAEQPMIERVCAYFQGQQPNPCTAAEALASLEIMDTFTGQ